MKTSSRSSLSSKVSLCQSFMDAVKILTKFHWATLVGLNACCIRWVLVQMRGLTSKTSPETSANLFLIWSLLFLVIGFWKSYRSHKYRNVAADISSSPRSLSGKFSWAIHYKRLSQYLSRHAPYPHGFRGESCIRRINIWCSAKKRDHARACQWIANDVVLDPQVSPFKVFVQLLAKWRTFSSVFIRVILLI